VNRARAWFREGGPAKKQPLALTARHDFQLLERTIQPTLPGPLPPNFAEWVPAPHPPIAGEDFLKTPELEGSRSALKNRLKVLSG
jgi:anaerobic magnesium-protoporphyrin IX monomethyl ester cyclase